MLINTDKSLRSCPLCANPKLATWEWLKIIDGDNVRQELTFLSCTACGAQGAAVVPLPPILVDH